MRTLLRFTLPIVVFLAAVAAAPAADRSAPGGPDAAASADNGDSLLARTGEAPASFPEPSAPEPPEPRDEDAWEAAEPSGRPKLEARVVNPRGSLPQPAIDSQGTIPLTLDQAVGLAVAHHLDLHGSRLDDASADARVVQQRGAFDPVINGVFRHSDSVSPSAFVYAVPLSQSKSDSYDFGIGQKLWYGASYDVGISAVRTDSNSSSLRPAYSTDLTLRYTQPLLRGFGRDANRAAIAQALNSATISRLNAEARARDVARDAITAYWELAYALRDLEVRRASLQLAQELLRKNRIMVEVGTLAPLEIAQAEASVAEREFRIIQAEKLVGVTQDNLRRVLGVTNEEAWWNASIVPLDEPAFRALTASLEEELATAMARRAEIPAAQLAVESAKLGVATAKDALLPQLNLELSSSDAGLAGDGQGSFRDADPFVDSDGDGDPTNDPDIEVAGVTGSMGRAFDQTFGRDFESWSAALVYSQPLRNRAAEGAYLVQRLALEDAKLSVAQLEQSIRLEVREAIRNLDSARESVLQARTAIALQEKKLDAEIKKFENGLSTNFEVLQYQTDLATAESAEARTLADYLQSQAELKRARGSLLQDYGLVAPK